MDFNQFIDLTFWQKMYFLGVMCGACTFVLLIEYMLSKEFPYYKQKYQEWKAKHK